MGFSRQEYWSGLTCPPPLDLPDPGSEPESLISPALADGFFTTSTTYTACLFYLRCPLSSRNRKLFTLTVWGFFPPKLVCFLFLPSALWCLVFTGLCLSSELSGNLCYFSAACPYWETLTVCYRGLWIRLHVSTKNVYTEILTPRLMVLGGGASGVTGSWEWSPPWHGISALIKEALQSALAPSPTWGHSVWTTLYEPGSPPWHGISLCFDLGLPGLQNCKQ